MHEFLVFTDAENAKHVHTSEEFKLVKVASLISTALLSAVLYLHVSGDLETSPGFFFLSASCVKVQIALQ